MQRKRNPKLTNIKTRKLKKYKIKITFLGINADNSPTRKQSQRFLLEKQQRFFFTGVKVLFEVCFIYIHWICSTHKESAPPAARLALRLATEGVYVVLFIKLHILRQCVGLMG